MYTNRNSLPAWLLTGVLTLAVPLCMAAEKEVTADQVVSALESTLGSKRCQALTIEFISNAAL